MKITPIEIRQHTFEKSLRGYRTDEVEAFLASLSQEWERVLSEHKMLKMQLELAEKELNKLREIELTLFKTLKTAEDTSSQITEQAQRAAEQYLNDSRKKADEVLADARKRSTLMVQDAENQARYIKENVLSDLKAMEHDFKAMERYKETLITQLRTLASGAIDSVDRFEKKFGQQSLQTKIEEISQQMAPETNGQSPEPALETTDATEPVTSETEATEAPVAALETPSDEAPLDLVSAQAAEPEEAGFPAVEPVAETEAEPEAQPVAEVTEEKPRQSGSFFDQI